MKTAAFHPGTILLTEYMQPAGLDSKRLAEHIHMDLDDVSRIIAGEQPITADVALRLARCFGTTDHFWMNLQTGFELARARTRLGNELSHLTQLA